MDDVIKDDAGSVLTQKVKTAPRKPVIKKNRLDIGTPHKIETNIQNSKSGHGGNIFPLIEGDEIIGFMYECSCGEVAKIIFEYEKIG